MNDRASRKIFNHIPNQSNDRLIEELINKIASRNPEEIKVRIENMFIAKIKNLDANALALDSRERYWSDLVFFHVGLSDVCFQFCINFLEFEYFRGQKNQFKENVHFIAKFFKDASALARNSVKWKENDKYIQLDVNTVVEGFNKKIDHKAASLATFTDMFILTHEISHHLLNHTGRSHDFQHYLEIIPEESLIWTNNGNQSFKEEFEADSFAILLLLGVTPENYKKKLKVEKLSCFEIAMGIIFTLEVISILSKNEMPSETHPPIEERIENVKIILNRFVSNQILNTIDQSISDYFSYINTMKR